MRFVLRSKIHRATITDTSPDYVGSITIDADLIEKSGLWNGEKVLVGDITNGARFETYVVTGKRGSGTVCVNGAAAHLVKKGDFVIIMGFELTDKPIDAKKVLVDAKNKFVRFM